MTKIDNRTVVARGMHDWLVFDAGGDVRLGIVTRCADIAGPFFFVASGTGSGVTFASLEEAVAACR